VAEDDERTLQHTVMAIASVLEAAATRQDET
jgi:hypothetical protein